MKHNIKKIGISVVLICVILITSVIGGVMANYENMIKLLMRSSQQTEISIEGLPSFITSEMILASLQVQETYGYPASVCIAQVIAESGFGSYGPGGESGQGLSGLAYNHKNLFGIKGKNGTAGGVQMGTSEQTSSGASYATQAWFRAYHTYTECIEDRAKILTDVYSDLISGVTDAKEFARKMGSRWATDIRYANKLIEHMDTYDLYRLDSMSVSMFQNSGGSWQSGQMPRFYQGDYANVPYGSSNLANCGCGPTSFAMVASYISGRTITPQDAVSWCGNRYYVSNVGTSFSYFSAAAQHFNLGVRVEEYTPSLQTTQTVLNALKQGKPVICSQTRGIFTGGGHYIVLSGITNDGKIMVNDPNKNNAVNKNYNNRKFDFQNEINVTALRYFVFT
jgi:hypothetical protein